MSRGVLGAPPFQGPESIPGIGAGQQGSGMRWLIQTRSSATYIYGANGVQPESTHCSRVFHHTYAPQGTSALDHLMWAPHPPILYHLTALPNHFPLNSNGAFNGCLSHSFPESGDQPICSSCPSLFSLHCFTDLEKVQNITAEITSFQSCFSSLIFK